VKFTATPLAGAYVVALEPHSDPRGFFARVWSVEEFAAQGLDPRISQTSLSHNLRRGTLRGMHWQAAPHAEAKLVRCERGALYDVIVDLRPDSPTYTHAFGVHLTAAEHNALYIPEGFAHGFQTLEDDTVVYYQMTTPYVPAAGRGARWNDPAFGITWPVPDPILMQRDREYPDFVKERRP
jgi:dTDP-4-dehydrorhamnose 3,5-epimerase